MWSCNGFGLLPNPVARKHKDLSGGILPRHALRMFVFAALLIVGLALAAVLIWEGFTAGSNPNPLAPHTDTAAAVLDIAVLVFREGLECILVLAAVTAGMAGSSAVYRRRWPRARALRLLRR